MSWVNSCMSNCTTPAGLFFFSYWNRFWPDQRIWPLCSLTDHKVFQPGLWNSGLWSVRASTGALTVMWHAKTRLNDPLPGENQFTGRLEVMAVRNKLNQVNVKRFTRTLRRWLLDVSQETCSHMETSLARFISIILVVFLCHFGSDLLSGLVLRLWLAIILFYCSLEIIDNKLQCFFHITLVDWCNRAFCSYCAYCFMHIAILFCSIQYVTQYVTQTILHRHIFLQTCFIYEAPGSEWEPEGKKFKRLCQAKSHLFI